MCVCCKSMHVREKGPLYLWTVHLAHPRLHTSSRVYPRLHTSSHAYHIPALAHILAHVPSSDFPHLAFFRRACKAITAKEHFRAVGVDLATHATLLNEIGTALVWPRTSTPRPVSPVPLLPTRSHQSRRPSTPVDSVPHTQKCGYGSASSNCPVCH